MRARRPTPARGAADKRPTAARPVDVAAIEPDVPEDVAPTVAVIVESLRQFAAAVLPEWLVAMGAPIPAAMAAPEILDAFLVQWLGAYADVVFPEELAPNQKTDFARIARMFGVRGSVADWEEAAGEIIDRADLWVSRMAPPATASPVSITPGDSSKEQRARVVRNTTTRKRRKQHGRI